MNHLLKILKLSQQAGDRLLVYNPEDPDNSWVAISLTDYEKFITESNVVSESEKSPENEVLTSPQQVDKMKSENTEANIEDEDVSEEDFSNFSSDNISRPVYSDKDYKNGPVPISNVLEKNKSKWKIPNQIKNSASDTN